ncbi:TGS domain-containing protein [Mesobacillus zeae]|uniref:TGS domain-containing protein n=1 Tax=Mesobacillus zeae TaxID=1917180 RepID=UPI0026A4DB15
MNEKLIKVQFLDGKIKEFPKGITVESVAESISSSLRKNAVVGKVDEQLVDLSYKIELDVELSVFTLDSEEGLNVLRHSSAHVLAQAVKRLFGNVKLGIGPVIEDGFYYDLKLEHSLTSEDLLAIEKEMENIINENLEIKRIEVSYEEAEQFFEEKGEPFKLEILRDIPKDEKITLYQQGDLLTFVVALIFHPLVS